MARLVSSISTNQDSFLINGIRFFWPPKPEVVRKTKLQRLKQIFGAGGDLGSVAAEE
jgi:hypothetical protein